MKEQITKIIKDNGIPASIRGFYYLRDAIDLFITSKEFISFEEIYKEIAIKYHRNVANVKATIRCAILKGAKNRGINPVSKTNFILEAAKIIKKGEY